MATFTSPGAAFTRAFKDAMREREMERRQALLDGILVSDRTRDHQRQEMADRRQAQFDAQAAEDRQRRIAHEDRQRQTAESAASNARGLDTMAADAINMPNFATDPNARRQLASTLVREGRDVPSYLSDAMRQPDEPKRHVVTTTDERGRPVQRLVDENELAAGVPVHREPREPRAPSYAWVERNGQVLRVSEGEIRPGDRPYNGGSGSGAPTQGQAAADAFYSRAKDASDVLVDVESDISQFNRYVPNFMQSEDGQAYEQAKRQFVEAYLRKDSGAAIADTEYANADRTYFIQPGDSPATVKRKTAARAKILDSLQQQGTGRSGSGNDGGSNRRTPAVGTRRTINGARAVWDGKGWLPEGRR